MNLNNIWINGYRDFSNAKPITGEKKVLVPGDPEREMEEERMKNGIPVVETVVKDLKSLAEKFNVSFI